MELLLNNINVLWILDIFNKLCLILDAIIYTVAGWLFNTFYKIAGMSIVNDFPAFEVILDRFKLFIGIFALFVLVKSLLSNLANPDNVPAAGSKIIVNVVVSIAILILSSPVFDILNEFQSVVINSNVIPKLVVNEEMINAAEDVDDSFLDLFTMDNVGNVFMNNMFLLFFKYEEEASPVGLWNTILNIGFNLPVDILDGVFGTVSGAIGAVREGAPIIGLLPFTNSSKISYEYPVVSGIVGLVFCYYFIKIAVAIGVRMFKLFVLQIFAPIPIVLYINPSQQQVFKNYLSYLFKTYADLFLRVFVIMFTYPMIITLTDGIIPDNSGNIVLNLILIFALLKFAKEFPKMLSELLHLDVKMADKGPGGFFGSIFGTGVGAAIGLATGSVGEKKLGGKDLALHTLSTAARAGHAGYKGGSQGVGGFTKAMVRSGVTAHTEAGQIYTSGGYGTFLKGKMYEKTGHTKVLEERRERYSDAVTQATQRQEKMNGYYNNMNSWADNMRSVNDRAVENSVQYQSLSHQYDEAIKSGDLEAASTLKSSMDNLKTSSFDTFYEKTMSGDFASLGSEYSPYMNEIASLKSIGDKINAELSDDFSKVDLSSYKSFETTRDAVKQQAELADGAVTAAERDLKEFLNSNEYNAATFGAERVKREQKIKYDPVEIDYSSSSSSTGSSGPRPSGSSASNRSNSTGTRGTRATSGPSSYTTPSGIVVNNNTQNTTPRSRTVYNPALERELANLEERAKANPNDAGLQREIEAIKKELGR